MFKNKTKKQTFSGQPGDCSEQQLETLDKFRAKVKEMSCTDPRFDDTYLLRFLRARKFDLNLTLEMWKNFINWRREKRVDEVYKMEIPEMKEARQYYPHLYFRTDKLGRPIYIERVGKMNLDKLLNILSVEKIEQHFIQDYERLLNEIFPACSEAKGERVYNTCYIMDMKGAASKMMSSKVTDMLKMISKIGQDNYPEILGQMFIINVPLFFYGVWNIVKHFVDEKTRKKITILGGNFKKELLEVIDEKNLPDFLGGKVTEADYGVGLSNEQGPWIKKEERLSQEKASTKSEEDFGSLELKDDFEPLQEAEKGYIRSVPVLMDRCPSIEELGDFDGEDIGQESPLKFQVKKFKVKAPTSFNVLA